MKQEESALVKTNDNRLREARKTNDSKFDRIYKYFHNTKSKVDLTEEERLILTRWEKSWLLLCRHRSRKQVVDLITRLFNVSLSVAYDDVRHSMMLFSDPRDDMKDAKRAIMETALLAGADRAWKNGDLDMHMKYMKEYGDINGLKHEGDNKIAELMKKIKATTINIVTSKEELEKLVQQSQDEITNEIDFEEVE